MSINVLLIFEMQETNGALFLKANFLSYTLSFGSVTIIVSFTTIYAALKSHKSDLSIDVLNLIGLFGLCLSLASPEQSWTFTHFLVINLGISFGIVPNKFAIFFNLFLFFSIHP